MRLVSFAVVSICSAAMLIAGVSSGQTITAPFTSCPARAATAGGVPVTWQQGRADDVVELEQWCQAVGAPIFVQPPASAAAPPPLEELAVVTWNTHLAEGRLVDLIAALRAGAFTSGRPVTHFVLLLQELYRGGSDVPAFMPGARTAFAILPRNPHATDARRYAASLGLSVLYVPSMRNGAELLEDRGNAIISTEPLLDPLALELPLERQRRVAIGTAIEVTIDQRPTRLALFNAHLEPLSSPKSLWIFRNPRGPQARAILDLLRTPRFDNGEAAVGTVLGGDFNIVQRGIDEAAYQEARAWSISLASENQRNTHAMGRIDHLFFRLDEGWSASTERLENRFGSDHYPVLGRFLRK
jgi:endonuclease/exonuclease/phosphatase family metal-dependent hydrolase